MKKGHISEALQLNIEGHKSIEFVDIALNRDNELFIDPLLIEKKPGEWSKQANECIKSFFDNFYDAYRMDDIERKSILLSHAREQNATKLGYGNGNNGKGNTANGLLETFRPLEDLIKRISTIGNPEDLPVLIPGFAEDGLSDLLTNILHNLLNDYTLDVIKKYKRIPDGTISFHYWDVLTSSWKEIEKPALLVNGKEILLVPKDIVRQRYLFGVNQYFSRIIIERMREEGEYRDVKGNTLSKKDIIKSKGYSGVHWKYDESIQYTIDNNDALEEYHRKLPGYYMEYGKPMTDEELDIEIYGM